MSDLEEVDVEQQLKAAEESGNDTESIILSEKDDTDDEDNDVIDGMNNLTDTVEDDMGQESDIETDDDKKYNIGDVVQISEYLPEFGVNQPKYEIKGITEEGKYLVERLTDDGSEVTPPKEVDEDMLSPVIPESPTPGPEVKDTDTPPPFIIDKSSEDNLEEISSDEDSDDEEYNEHMRKLENDINRDYLQEYHPETKQINFKELSTLSNVTRNKKGIIIDPLHITIPILTRYEKAKILGLRAKQLNHGAKSFVELSKEIIDGHTIANMELIQNKIPFIIRRPMPNGGSEYWKVNDLKIIE
jgi:DNA-directed RNA polymerase subunit K/omega